LRTAAAVFGPVRWIIACDRLSIDDAGARAQAGQCIDDQREATGEIIAGPHLWPVLPGDNPNAIVLDLVQPLTAGSAARPEDRRIQLPSRLLGAA
jgi:hypothetical protein